MLNKSLVLRVLGGWTLLFVVGGCASAPTKESDVFENITQLTSGYTAAGEAYFSPDMRWIVYQATPAGEGGYQMYVARLLRFEGVVTGIGQPIRVSPQGSINTCGYFSPDGVSLIFASTAGKPVEEKQPGGYQRDSGRYRWAFHKGMDVFRADAWQGAIAAAEFSAGIDLAQHRITDNDAYDAECAYSPNGRHIVFTSTRDADPAKPVKESRDADLYVMRADGSNVVRLTTADGYDGGAFFSPDGRSLVYRSDRKNDNLLQLFVADVARDAAGNVTGLVNEKQITSDPAVHFGPFWHPDGQHLVYAASTENHSNYEVFQIRRDGTKKLRLTFTAGADLLPAFSPDGRYMMWTSKRSADRTSQIWIAKYKKPAAG
ncbi:MAG TPA: hypothetical protein VF624_07425 [Tepidisphaeraceae bacterium]|jgi:WD40 repeat protein